MARKARDHCHKAGNGASTPHTLKPLRALPSDAPRPYSRFMSESSKIGESQKAAQKARQERRLAVALRENLKRRKAQAKGRVAVQSIGESPAAPHDSAGIADDKRNR
jgi:hypothetical protein